MGSDSATMQRDAQICEEDTDFPDLNVFLTKLPFGEQLIRQGVLSRDQLRIALHEQKSNPGLLGTILVRLGFLEEETLAMVLAHRAGVPSVNLNTYAIDSSLLRHLPHLLAEKYAILPLRLSQYALDVAMADPFDIVAMDELRRAFPRGIEIQPHVAAKSAIEDALAALYGANHSIDDLLKELETGERLLDDSFEHPVVRLVNTILIDAVQRGASDIHLEPENNFIRVRFRVDGILLQRHAFHAAHWPALSHRLKIMASMNIADTRSIQDGRFSMHIRGNDVDFRVAIMPTVWGETIVVRLLDHRRSLHPLDTLGYSDAALERIKKIACKPQGITLVTGPTGSGKTTTLYSLLQKLSTKEVHIATLEEPVEYMLDLVRQTSIQESLGLNFASGVRGILRMDPDIILIGEIRDSETAQMALRAAMTGHQVYATLHCNEAVGALPRLLDLGLNARLLPGNLSGFMAQRLVRRLCPACKELRPATEAECRLLRTNLATRPQIADATGCMACDHTGRKGRTVIAEVLPISDTIDDLIAADAPRAALIEAARSEGFTTMQEDGIQKVLAGEIALSDLQRAVDLTRGDHP